MATLSAKTWGKYARVPHPAAFGRLTSARVLRIRF
jgi:hypothetical protein